MIPFIILKHDLIDLNFNIIMIYMTIQIIFPSQNIQVVIVYLFYSPLHKKNTHTLFTITSSKSGCTDTEVSIMLIFTSGAILTWIAGTFVNNYLTKI